MAVHFPEVDGFSCFVGFLACLPEVGAPVDFHPAGFGLGGFDGGDELFLGVGPLGLGWGGDREIR